MFPVCTIEQIDPIDPIDPVDTMDPIDQIDAGESLGRSQGTGVLGVICLGWGACREGEGHSAVLPLCLFAVFCCRLTNNRSGHWICCIGRLARHM